MRKAMTALAVILATTPHMVGSASAADNKPGVRFLAKLMFELGDTNGDKRLDYEEIAALRMRGFDRADTNSDGLLTKAENDAAAAKRKRRGEMAALAGEGGFERFDSDGDGSVTRAEFRDGPRPFLELIDTNSDGAIDHTELDRLAEIITRSR